MKKREPMSVGEIIHEVFVRAGMEDNEARQRACAMWGDVVGPGINRHTTRRYVSADGLLHVWLDSAPLKSDLQFMRAQLVRQLNEFAGSTSAIKDIVIH